jgi:serine/threonine protein kinase
VRAYDSLKGVCERGGVVVHCRLTLLGLPPLSLLSLVVVFLAQIADFGLTRELDSNYYYRSTDERARVPLRWTSPEAVLERKFSEASDVWAYGVTAWEIFSCAATPYGELTNDQLIERVLRRPSISGESSDGDRSSIVPDRFDSMLRGHTLERPPRCPVAMFEDIIARCLLVEPADRPTFENLVEQLTAPGAQEYLTRTRFGSRGSRPRPGPLPAFLPAWSDGPDADQYFLSPASPASARARPAAPSPTTPLSPFEDDFFVESEGGDASRMPPQTPPTPMRSKGFYSSRPPGISTSPIRRPSLPDVTVNGLAFHRNSPAAARYEEGSEYVKESAL